MCGISGYYGKFAPQTISKMIEALNHRGPDDNGYAEFNNGQVAVANNRLAIIDLSSNGHQPMSDPSGRYTIVFNGEIYNFQEIREKLVNKYTFKSKSDTEVLLYAYIEWGPEFLKQLNGMFGLVIYDRDTDMLFGARDRLGEKPLKYYYDGDTFIFASEVKAILKILPTKPEIDQIAINHFLTLQYVPAPMTGFKNIFKLPPAHYFIYKDKKLTLTKYWELAYSKKETRSVEEWSDMILQGLDKSVRMRLVSDVPVGALLSGGVDSSAVVAYMAKNITGRVKTFSIGFDHELFDESKYALQIAEMYNTEHTSVRLDHQSLKEMLPKLATYYDEPMADNSILPTFFVTKMAREHVTVALNGDGGDENFAGYDRYNFVRAAKDYKFLGNGIFKYGTNLIYKKYPSKFTERLNRFCNTLNDPFTSMYLNYLCFFTNDVKNSIFSDEFIALNKSNDTFELFNTLYNKTYDDVDNALNIDINTYLPEDLLYKTDIASMANSLELRAPLLDPEFMEMTAKIPSDLKIHEGTLKYIFKKALVSKNILPSEVVYRRKQGFNIPLNKWLKYEMKAYVSSVILSEKLTSTGIFNKGNLETYLDSYFNSKLNQDNNIFALLMLTQWINNYF